MPTPQAVAAFNRAQRIAAEIREIHAKEEALNQALAAAEDELTRELIEHQIILQCAQWHRLHRDYTAAFVEYTAEVSEPGVSKGLHT